MSEDSAYSKVKLLTSGNYPQWSGEVGATLKRKGLWRLVIGKEKRPEAADKKAVSAAEHAAMDAWDVRAEKASGELFLLVELDQRQHLVGIDDDPVAMWTKLASVHLQQHPGARFNAYDDLLATQKREDESLASLSTRVDQTMTRIKNLRPKGFTIEDLDDELACMAMLRALPDEYSNLTTSIQIASTLNKDTLLQAFITEDITQQRRVKSETPPAASALSASASTSTCAFCSLPGHSIDSCFRFREAKVAATKSAQEKRQERQQGGRKRPQKANAAKDEPSSPGETSEFAGSTQELRLI